MGQTKVIMAPPHQSWQAGSARAPVCVPARFVLCAALAIVVANSAHADNRLSRVNEKLRTGEPLVLAALGDSITWICFHTDGRRNYVTFVAEALRKRYPAANIHVEISGNRGSTVRAMPFLETLLEVKPDLVFIMFGMNDSTRGVRSLDEYDRNLTALIRRTREAAAIPVVLTQNEIVYPAEGRQALPEFEARAVEVARRENVPCVDNFSDWKLLKQEEPETWKLYLNDVMHPNLAGHRRFAKAILRQLWPEAGAFQPSGLWTAPASTLSEPVSCTLPGPADKQVLRIGSSTWIALTGRRRGSEITDVVLSVAHARLPAWNDFRHVTLVGPERTAVFPWGEPTINSALLLQSDHRLFILFSHTVRRSALVIDIERPDWIDDLAERHTYKTTDGPDVSLPQSLGGSYQEDTEFLDGWVAGDALGYLYRDLVPGGNSGVIEATLPRAPTLLFPGFRNAQAGLISGEWIVIARDERGRLAAARQSRAEAPQPPLEAQVFSFSAPGGVPLLVARREERTR